MRNSYYIATQSKEGLHQGKIYFSGDDMKVTLDGERVSVLKLLTKGLLKAIPYYEGKFKETWSPDKKTFLMSLDDGMGEDEVNVTLLEYKASRDKSLSFLGVLPNEETVQIDVINPQNYFDVKK